MEWIKIDKENLPEGEVLAGNFKKGTYGFKEKCIGFLGIDEGEDFVSCENDNEVLENCAHYIDLSKHDPE